MVAVAAVLVLVREVARPVEREAAVDRPHAEQFGPVRDRARQQRVLEKRLLRRAQAVERARARVRRDAQRRELVSGRRKLPQ